MTHVTEVLLHQLVRCLVDQLVVVALQQLDAVQAAQLLHQQAQLLRLAQLLRRLQDEERRCAFTPAFSLKSPSFKLGQSVNFYFKDFVCLHSNISRSSEMLLWQNPM